MVLNIFNRDKIYAPAQRIAEFTIVKKIGEGRYGICYQARDGHRQYILKQLKREMLKKAGASAGFEAEILMKLQHNSIPRFIKKVDLDHFYGYVLEYKPGKTFEDLLYADRYTFKKLEILNIGAQLITILKYLHAQGIVHRDIRVPNTLYENNKVFLIDFGLARWIDAATYKAAMDFAYLGDFLLHLYYSTYEPKDNRARPWYEELPLSAQELHFLKRLMGLEDKYTSIGEIESEFLLLFKQTEGLDLKG